MDWIESLNRALAYVEAHLSDDLDVESVAKEAMYSPFALQRAFAIMTDMSLSEYIRRRRLSAAGQELRSPGARVIDVAYKYGYETPESFQKAFRRFHGVSPSAAKKPDTALRYLNPLKLRITLSGGTVMHYEMETVGKLHIRGMERRFRYDSAFKDIPLFWDEYFAKGYNKAVPGFIGVCLDEENSPEFTYLIASFCEADAPVPEGFVLRELPAVTWAKFRAVGPTPESIQRVNRQVYTEWLPNNPEYELSAGMNIEVYSEGDMSAPDYECELWIPVTKKTK